MKHSLLLSVAAVGLMSFTEANAEYRKWNFSNWSSATINAVQNSADWTNDEKGDGSSNVVPNNACVWNTGANVGAACNEDGYLMANGQVISELEGLKWQATAAKKIAIAIDYQVTTDANKWGPYNGSSYLWLNGKTTAVHFVIPAVEPGTTIKMGLESHKPGDARGVDLLVGGVKLEKEPNYYPTDYEEFVWVTPEDGEAVDVDVQPSNGCHIYFIEVGEDTGSEVNDINIAYLYDSSYNGAKDSDKNPCGWLKNGGLDRDPIYAALQTYNVTAIDYNGQTLTSTELNDSLLKFDVVVAGECVSSGNVLAKGLIDIVNKVPMLNLKSFMYKSGVWSWGAGANPSPKATSVVVTEDFLEDPLFADLEMEEDGTLPLFECEDVTALNGNLIQGYTASAGSLIEADEVLGTVGDGTKAIHRHGQKNQYLLIPLSSDNMDLVHGNVYTIIDNAVKLLAATKSKVQNAAAPVIAQDCADMQTTVSITCATAGSTIYFTTDGTEPTTASPVYSEPFVVTESGMIVKAFATAHGYNDSNITTAEIDVMRQYGMPSIHISAEEGKTTIDFDLTDDGANVYYSFNGVKSVQGAQYFTETIVLNEPATITCFSAGELGLQSEALTLDITVGGIPAVKDTVAHFTANEEDWFTNAVIKDANFEDQPTPESNWAAKAAYYWGKSAWSCFSDEVDHTEPVLNEDGSPVLDINGQDSIKTIYKLDPQAVKYVYSNTDTQWRLRSQGQIFTGECNVAASYLVGGPDMVGYYAETATDLIGEPSKGKMTFGGKASGEPYNASIESTVKFQAPFDIVTYTTNGGGSAFNIEIQTSADGENWTAVGTLPVASTQRYYKKDRCHVSETAELYVRLIQIGGSTKAQLYDIYVITTEGMTGIETITDDAAQATSQLFDLFGRQLQAPVQGKLFIQNGRKMIVK